MRTTTLKATIAIAVVLATQRVHPQGTFVNLDFEQAIAPLVPDPGGMVPIVRALPGWTGYVGGVQVSGVWYDTRTIDAPCIALEDRLVSNPQLEPLQGDYSVWLTGASRFGTQQAASIAQLGQIPAETKSIRFLFSTTYLPELTFAGQTIPLVQLGANPSYITLGGDVSSFAGDTGELRFTFPSEYSGGVLDSIEFSPAAIPEPTAVVLSLLGVLIVGWGVRRTASIRRLA